VNFQALARKPFKVIAFFLLGLILSLGWWSLAIAGNRPESAYLPVSLLAVMGGFLPALVIIAIMHFAKANRKSRLRLKSLGILGFVAYPILITVFYFSQLLTAQPSMDLKWLFHPAILVFNLMAVLVIGPIADCLGIKARVTNTLKEKFPTNQGKLIALFTYWIWHLPLIFLNGSALSALGFSNGFLGGYLLTILMISYFLSWGYDRERRLVLFTALKHY
jgi:uncharacterized protein